VIFFHFVRVLTSNMSVRLVDLLFRKEAIDSIGLGNSLLKVLTSNMSVRQCQLLLVSERALIKLYRTWKFLRDLYLTTTTLFALIRLHICNAICNLS
jgi:hypothetical protein